MQVQEYAQAYVQTSLQARGMQKQLSASACMQRSLIASGPKKLRPRETVRLDEVLLADTT